MPFNAYTTNPYNPFPVGTNLNTAGQYVPQYGQYAQYGQPVQQQRQDQQPLYVHGIEGANAFQMPPGVNKVTLWDEDKNEFFIKGYDNNGIPRVLAWNDYGPHKVEQEPVKESISQVDLSNYVTKDDMNRMLKELTIGANGRIVRQNEHDA